MRRPHTVGVGSYAKAPPMAWAGWRLTLPGGPPGGQYHGYLGKVADDHACTCGGTCADCSGGTALREGDTVSDYVYRSPAEMRPRSNASGMFNTSSVEQAPHGLGAAGVVIDHAAPVFGIRTGLPIRAYPVWGNGGQPERIVNNYYYPTGATNIVAQPPPPNGPGGTLVQSSPVPISPAPSPTVPVDPTSSMLPSQGLTLAQQSGAPAGIDVMGWLTAQSTIFPSLQNWMLLAGAALAYKFLMPSTGGKR
jgi:hypothetical protein